MTSPSMQPAPNPGKPANLTARSNVTSRSTTGTSNTVIVSLNFSNSANVVIDASSVDQTATSVSVQWNDTAAFTTNNPADPALATISRSYRNPSTNNTLTITCGFPNGNGGTNVISWANGVISASQRSTPVNTTLTRD